jgi:hypothetical protein
MDCLAMSASEEELKKGTGEDGAGSEAAMDDVMAD